MLSVWTLLVQIISPYSRTLGNFAIPLAQHLLQLHISFFFRCPPYYLCRLEGCRSSTSLANLFYRPPKMSQRPNLLFELIIAFSPYILDIAGSSEGKFQRGPLWKCKIPCFFGSLWKSILFFLSPGIFNVNPAFPRTNYVKLCLLFEILTIYYQTCKAFLL